MTRILVTGGAVFIGSHLLGALLKEEYDVTVLDNYSTGSVRNLDGYQSSTQMRIVKEDVRNLRAVAKMPQGDLAFSSLVQSPSLSI